MTAVWARRRGPAKDDPDPSTQTPHLEVIGAFALTVAAVFIARSSAPGPLAAALGGICVLGVFHRSLIAWRSLLVGLALVVMLVPMRRYALPINLPYQLEPYRILVLMIVGAVVVSLLIDPALHLRKLGFGGWFGLYVFIAVMSLVPNYADIAAAGTDRKILGAVAGLLTVLVAFVSVRLLLLGRREAHAVLGAIAIGSAIVGLIAILERRSGENPLRVLDGILPVAKGDEAEIDDIGGALRFGRLRAFGSAQHPVALGAQLVIVLPISAYLARHAMWPLDPVRRQRFWLACAALSTAGLVMSVSRLAIVALVAVAVCAVWLRPETGRVALKLAIPLVCATVLFGGGALADLADAFNPTGGLIAEQSIDKSARSSGRLADIRRVRESLDEAPLLGKGMGARAAVSDDRGRLILDNEYFGRLVDTGLLGFVAFVGLVGAPIRRTWLLARRAAIDQQVSDLAAALCCSFVGFAVGLLFYDGLSFLQPVMTFALLLAVAGWVLNDVVRPVTPEPAGRLHEPLI